MTKHHRVIPKASAAKILHEANGDRVSDKAAEEFAEALEEIGLEIAEQAVKFSKHSGRKTVNASDVKLASRD